LHQSLSFIPQDSLTKDTVSTKMKGDSELSKRFALCSFSPITNDLLESSRIVVHEGAFATTSFLMDSSGRSKFMLPLQVACTSKEDVDYLVNSGCLPMNDSDNDDDNNETLRIEITCHSPNLHSDKVVTVEDIRIISCSPKGNSIMLVAEIIVRASNSYASSQETKSAFHRSIITQLEEDLIQSDNLKYHATSQLQVTAVLVTQRSNRVAKKSSYEIPAGLAAMQFVGGIIPLSEQSSTRQTRLTPFSLQLFLTQALQVSTNSVPGSNSGKTLLSLTITHANTYEESVEVTNIAFHPAHSRYDITHEKTDVAMPGGQNVVIDMSKHVKWGFGGGTEPSFPLKINPHEAFSLVLTIDAGEDLRSRSFFSPITVTAIVDSGFSVVETADALWTTGRIAVEPADAFRIDLSLQQSSSCFVGAPLVVALRVLNLSTETRDLMLVMAKDDEKYGSSASSSKHGSVNTAIVSEVNGYTFGVWGLSGDDDGTVRHNRDHELLAVDAALLLGEVKGQHSVDAELRFVPLREGTLDVPNLKLYDKTEGKWYNCMHMLKIVAAGKPE
jgi:hypothetical protein